MKWLRRTWRRLRAALSSGDGSDVRDEVQLHLDLLTEEYRTTLGLSDVDARARAMRDFGRPVHVVERTREVTTFPTVESWLSDIVYAWRHLLSTAGVSALAIASLGLAIGAATALVTIVNALVLRPLPVPEPRSLVALTLGDVEQTRAEGARWSYGFWRALSAHQHQFDGLLAWSSSRVPMAGTNEAEEAQCLLVNGDFFRTLQLPMLLGRPILEADDAPGSPPVAVISYAFWQSRFSGDANILARTLDLQDARVPIVGVTSPGFTGLEVGQGFDAAMPLAAEPLVRGQQSFLKAPADRMIFWLRVGARLQVSQSIESASQLVQALQPQLRAEALPPGFPEVERTFLREPFSLFDASTGLSRLRFLYQRPLYVLLVIVGLLLALACVNVANLLLGQTTARAHDLSLRLALGATRWRLARQLLVESALLSAAGITLGVLVAQWTASVLVSRLASAQNPAMLVLTLDWRVLLITSALGIVVTLACGLAAAWRVRSELPRHPGCLAAGTQGARHAPLAMSSLLTVQVAVTLALVLTAGLFVRTFAALASVPTGVNADGVLVANVTVLRADVAGERALAMYHQLAEAVRGIPGVAAAAASTSTPITNANSPAFITPLTRTGDDATEGGDAKLVYVTPGWFHTYGVPLRAGRDVDANDRGQTLPVAVVNDAFISRFFPGTTGIDQSARVAVGARGEKTLSTRTIVGVVGNTVYQSPREVTQPIIYLPLAQYDYPLPVGAYISVTARVAAGRPERLSNDVAAAITGVNPRLVVATRTLESQIDDALRQERLLAGVISALGILALVLAALGLFGVTAHGVARRQRELAIRIAIGATPSTILREVSMWVMVPLTVGLTLGVMASLSSGRLLSSLLFGVAPSDLNTLLLAVGIMAVTAAVAMAIPAWRAIRVDPARTLRTA